MSGRGRSAVARLLVLSVAGSLPLLAPVGATAGPGDIATFAGGIGAGIATQLSQVPEYIAVSGTTVYISDTKIAVVRKLDTTTGRETVVAGSGFGWSGDGGPATQAKFSHPTGLALDSKGDLFISDTYNNQVHEVTPDGILHLVAGKGLGGYSGDGGPASAAQLLAPIGIAVDAHDNLFIADTQNNAIRKVDMTSGVIQTVLGSGLNWPADVTFDLAGDLLVADSGNGRVARVLASGSGPITIAGGGSGGVCSPCPALSAGLFGLQGIAIDGAGNLLIADSNGNRIRKVDKLDGTGTITTVAGGGTGLYGGDGGPATSATLNRPVSVRANAAGEFFIADRGNERGRKVDAGQTISTIAGTGSGVCGYAGDGGPAVQAQLCAPRGVAVDAAGDLFLADGQGARVRKVDTSGTITTVAGNGSAGYSGDGHTATAGQLNVPEAVAVDAAGDLFIADTYNDVVREVTLDGLIRTVAGNHTRGYGGDGGPAIQAELNTPTGVGFDAMGNLLIADYYNSRIRKVDGAGTITTMVGTATAGFSGDGGPASQAQLNFPAGVTLDAAGNLFIADAGNNRIRKVDPSGLISTIAGAFGAVALGDGGPAVSANLSLPWAVAVGPHNVLYIDDSQNQRIRMVTADGIIHTAAGAGQVDARGFSGDGGPATAAWLNDPYGVAVDSAGDIFIGDQGNGRVRRVEAYGLPGVATSVVATGVSGGARVTWTAPPSGGTAISSYTVTPYQGTTAGAPTTVSGSPAPTTGTVTGLIRGQTYTFVVTAINAVGAGPPSQPSNAITVYLAPGPPTAVQAVAQAGAAQVSWTAPADNGGQPIVSYLVTAITGGTAQTSATVTGAPPPTTTLIQGLTNGTFYTFIVAASNNVGTGAPSAASNAVRVMGSGSYHALPPSRILDTRSGLGSVRAPLASGQNRHVTVMNRGGVPGAGVSAVVLNVTVTNTSASGYLTVYPTGGAPPNASNLNWTAHRTVANLVEVAVGNGGQVDIYVFGSSADVIFDVQGWVGVPANSGGRDGLFNGLAPARILDTRDGIGGTTHALGAGSTLNLTVAGSVGYGSAPSGVPATGAAAVVLNVTVTNPSRSSYLTVYPAGSQRPVASNLNFTAGQTVANRVIVPLGSGGAITIFNAAGSVDVVADVNGWFTDQTTTAGGTDFIGGPPSRLLDTRTPGAGGPLQGGAEYLFYLLDQNGNPITGVTAIVVNVTATDATTAGYVTLWPNTVTRPVASDVNFLAGQTVPNLVVLQLGANATFRIYNAAGDTDLIMDVVGFYGTQDTATSAPTMRAVPAAFLGLARR